jgi:hypothetical protein
MTTEQTIVVGDYITFRRGKATLTGTILAMDHVSRRPIRRRVTIATTVKDWAGNQHTGNVTVFYSDIIGLAEKPVEKAQVTP